MEYYLSKNILASLLILSMSCPILARPQEPEVSLRDSENPSTALIAPPGKTNDLNEHAQDAGEHITKAKDLAIAFRIASAELLPSVVTVYATARQQKSALENLQLLPAEERFESMGSGVILTADGLIVTNAHVVADSTEVMVRLDDGREFAGSDIRTDKSSDVAILRISSPTPLTAAKLGNSDDMAVGEWVLAIGSPFNFEQTVSAGIISGKSRVLKGMVEGQLLQTDASINPGNSGGALANLDGELIGINTAIASRTGASQGIGFAIPSNRMKWVTDELVKYGKVRRSMIGLRAEPLPQAIAEQLKLPISAGVYVSRVRANQPAAKAGIEVGDVILELAGQRFRSERDFAAAVEQLPANQPHPIVVMRNGERMELEVTLEARESD